MVHNTTTAISRVAQEMGVTVRDYTVAPRFCLETANGYHEWVVEFDTPPADPDHFIERIDQELRTLNSDYEAKRYADMALLMPVWWLLGEDSSTTGSRSRASSADSTRYPAYGATPISTIASSSSTSSHNINQIKGVSPSGSSFFYGAAPRPSAGT